MLNVCNDRKYSKKNRFQKLISRAYIDWLINYQFINIYKIWIFEKKLNRKIISTCDVLFDKKKILAIVYLIDYENHEIEINFDRIQLFQTKIDNAKTFIENEYIIEHLYKKSEKSKTLSN